MTIQVIQRNLLSMHKRQPVLSLLWRFPLQTLKQEILEVSLGMVFFLFVMKSYYRVLRTLYPVLQIINPSISRRWYLWLSFFFYEYFVPSNKKLIQMGVKLYKKI